jgi:7-cyano-7-deazaguanine synthase in queuosine biosynthesis
MKNITILYSGGLDSFALWHLARCEHKDANVRCLFFDIGQPYIEKEKAALPNYVEVRKVDWLSIDDNTQGKDNPSGSIYVPGRNLVLLTLASAITLPDELWLGALAGEVHDRASDKNYQFLDKAQTVIEYALRDFCPDIKLRFPFADRGWNKLHVVQWLLSNGVHPSAITATSSCLSGCQGNCGDCVVCLRRWGIFTQLGLSETYNIHPLESTSNRKVLREMLVGSYYDEFRKDEVLPALSKSQIDSILGK